MLRKEILCDCRRSGSPFAQIVLAVAIGVASWLVAGFVASDAKMESQRVYRMQLQLLDVCGDPPVYHHGSPLSGEPVAKIPTVTRYLYPSDQHALLSPWP